MNFSDAIKSGFRNYVNFSGRAARSEYWYWSLFCGLIGIGSALIDIKQRPASPHLSRCDHVGPMAAGVALIDDHAVRRRDRLIMGRLPFLRQLLHFDSAFGLARRV